MSCAFGESLVRGASALARSVARCTKGGIIRGVSASRSLEGRLPLLDEGGHALGEVVAADQLVLDLSLEVQLRLEVAVEHAVERPLRAGVRARRPACELPH